ncbi:glutamate-5-semialdehyde dehydrogenase [Thorsellia kenyensis]|uniref:Gamma-glutamyl phosphate reductase n=1 Tax=Thorsellia kenyensis TaxID=1549888 RepID=A0ABV6C749_9GAMM
MKIENQKEIAIEMQEIARAAKHATWDLVKCSADEKNQLLLRLAEALLAQKDLLIAANKQDLLAAEQANLPPSLIARLVLDNNTLKQIIDELRHVASLPTPIGNTLEGKNLTNGLRLERRVVPLGVVAVIYEARPNVTIDVASLCLKTSNAVILRGGKETQHTNKLLVSVIQDTLEEFNLPRTCVQAITDPDRAWVNELLKQDKYIDMLIPRGGAALHKLCKENSFIPVITGGIGVCHIYLESSYIFNGTFDTEKIAQAIALIENAKCQRPSACNSLETLLIDAEIAEAFIPLLYDDLLNKGVSFRVCPNSMQVLNKTNRFDKIQEANDVHYSEESLSLALNIKMVNNMQTAIKHIREYGTAHSDAILTQSMQLADLFVDSVDSAAVYVNASTRFTDGAQFGLGAEVAVSTQKLHARGPMGLEALTTYKWIGRGENTLRQ